MGGPSRAGTAKNQVRLLTRCARRGTTRPDYTSSERSAICFPLENGLTLCSGQGHTLHTCSGRASWWGLLSGGLPVKLIERACLGLAVCPHPCDVLAGRCVYPACLGVCVCVCVPATAPSDAADRAGPRLSWLCSHTASHAHPSSLRGWIYSCCQLIGIHGDR